MNSDAQCPLWGTDAEFISVGSALAVNSPRAGGRYKVDRSIEGRLATLVPSKKVLVSSWIAEQHRNGVDTPEIRDNTLDEIVGRRPLSFSEKTDRIMRYCENEITKIGDTINADIYNENDTSAYALFVLTESQDAEELQALISYMADMGLIKEEGGLGELAFAPTVSGWLKIEELRSSAPNVGQAFVAMWFHASTLAAYQSGIKPAITECGYDPLRIDGKQHVNKIDDEIISEIRRSRFLVADFTCETGKVRGGVYFEAGFAMALGIPVIWTCSENSISDLHFDTRQYNHISWREPTDLYAQLKARIGAIVGEGPFLNRPR